ncbi:unnamed protein product, partial [marine sediment metagenome]
MAKEDIKIVIKGVDKIGAVLRRVTNRFPILQRQVRKTNLVFRRFERRMKRFGKTFKKVGKGMARVGKGMIKATVLPLGAAIAFSTKKFIDYEEGMLNVFKTTDLTFDQ